MATGVDQAAERLNLAIERLEDTMSRQDGARVDKASLDTEIQVLEADRARLADLLDKSEAKAARLETTARDVSQKLVEAMETIRSIMHADSGGA
jgi:chromosome segregation ATPase